MKSLVLAIVLFCSNFLTAQNNIVTPPEKVKMTFEKEYPGKVPVWSMKYVGDDDDEIRYEAKFNTEKNTKALAVYDNLGVLKAYELQISMSQLPLKAQNYLKKNYSPAAIKEIVVVVDDKNKTTYEAGVEKNSKFYDVVFDKNGGFEVSIEKD
ncbi:hypothetical protein [Flavobacterium gelatinilyticum]|uniref:hypothetical protein n=1 Tax=Flavobacterium gelatinilyticum TaxID=3003260 RepID=UPI0024800659|nr:hypothetical protein [Flavobacterium gelatinilyticum]